MIPQLRGAYGTVVMDSRDPSVLSLRAPAARWLSARVGETSSLPINWRCAGHPPLHLPEEGDVEVTRRTVNIFDKQGNAIERPEIESRVQYDAGDKGAYRQRDLTNSRWR